MNVLKLLAVPAVVVTGFVLHTLQVDKLEGMHALDRRLAVAAAQADCIAEGEVKPPGFKLKMDPDGSDAVIELPNPLPWLGLGK